MIYTYALVLLILVFSVIVHECAHGYVALWRGDPTAKMLGRLTLNPIPHMDLLGTVILPLIMFLFSNIIFAYAKAVPVNPNFFKSPRKDLMLVAAAGPLSNLLLAAIGAIPLRFGMEYLNMKNPAISIALQYLVSINIILAVLNLIPLPPLDGSRILKGFVSSSFANKLDQIEPYGFFIILILFYLGLFQLVILPVSSMISQLLIGL